MLAGMLVERVEITETKDERIANVLFRFDPKAVAASIPVGRTEVVQQKGKKSDSGGKNDDGGGSGGT